MKTPKIKNKLTFKIVQYCIWKTHLQLGVLDEHYNWFDAFKGDAAALNDYLERCKQEYAFSRGPSHIVLGHTVVNFPKTAPTLYLVAYNHIVKKLKEELHKEFDELELAIILRQLIDKKQLHRGPVEGTYWLGRKFPRWFE